MQKSRIYKILSGWALLKALAEVTNADTGHLTRLIQSNRNGVFRVDSPLATAKYYQKNMQISKLDFVKNGKKIKNKKYKQVKVKKDFTKIKVDKSCKQKLANKK